MKNKDENVVRIDSTGSWMSCVLQDKAFKSGLNEFCERQPLKKLKGYGLLKQAISLEIF